MSRSSYSSECNDDDEVQNPIMASSSKLWSVKDEIFTLDTKLQVREFLGSGAYGVVCSAWNSESDEMVAIKKCKKILASKTMAKRMLRELRILRFLEHSNVVKILGIQRLANRETFEELYVVLEYMETDLAQIIRSSQTLREEHVQYFTYQMLLALEYIHGCRVMHRDIKPRNILVNSNCDLKIADFGLSRIHDDVSGRRTVAMTEYVTTRWYRAPEILVGWQNYSYAIDNWAVGTIVAELIGRKPLFIGKDTVEQLDTIFSVLGKPPDTFINACKKPEIRHYVRYVNVETITPLSVVYPRASRTAIDLISSLLVFDPTLRMTAKHALRHPFVAKFNRGFPNPHCPLPVVEFMFDSTVPSIEQLRDEILFEVDYFNPPEALCRQDPLQISHVTTEQEDDSEVECGASALLMNLRNLSPSKAAVNNGTEMSFRSPFRTHHAQHLRQGEPLSADAEDHRSKRKRPNTGDMPPIPRSKSQSFFTCWGDSGAAEDRLVLSTLHGPKKASSCLLS